MASSETLSMVIQNAACAMGEAHERIAALSVQKDRIEREIDVEKHKARAAERRLNDAALALEKAEKAGKDV